MTYQPNQPPEPIPYARPVRGGVPIPSGPGYCKDPYFGWWLGGWLLIFNGVMQIVAVIASAFSVKAQAEGFKAEAVIGRAVLGAAIAIIAACGLLSRQTWGKWMTLVLVGLATSGLIMGALMVNGRDLPLGSHFPTLIAAVILLAAWMLLLDFPAKVWRVTAGGIVLVLMSVAGMVVLLLE